MPKTAPISRVKPIRTHNLLGKPDYVPRVVWGKVTNVLRVPEVLPSWIDVVGLSAQLGRTLRGSG